MSLTRRHLIQGASGLAVALVAGCKNKIPASCTDIAGLTPDEVRARTTLGYVDRTASTDKSCENCQQFVAATADGACGSCKILKGPIHPSGYCRSYSAKD